MPFNSSNVFQRLYNWVTDRDNSVPILAERVNADTDDIVAGINKIMSGEADFIGPLKGVNGTASAPAYSFTDDPDSGFYRAAGNTVGVSTGGAMKVEISGLETRLFNNLVVKAGTITNIQLNNSTTSQSSFPTPDASVGAPPKIEGSYEDGYVGIVLHPKQTANYDLAITMKEGDEGGPQWWADAVEYKIWTENNDGSGSGLDADLLDGKEASDFLSVETSAYGVGSVVLANNQSGGTIVNNAITAGSNIRPCRIQTSTSAINLAQGGPSGTWKALVYCPDNYSTLFLRVA